MAPSFDALFEPLTGQCPLLWGKHTGQGVLVSGRTLPPGNPILRPLRTNPIQFPESGR